MVAAGSSRHAILLSEGAPRSVHQAADELQLVIEQATGLRLPLQYDAQPWEGPVISLGATRRAQAAGLRADEMPDGGWRIVVRGSDLFILGPDTPDGSWTARNGTSTGTANGVYVLLEDHLDARWLMPGDLGRSVPTRRTIELPPLDIAGVPAFSLRRVTHLWDHATHEQYTTIRAWTRRMRVGRFHSSTTIEHEHNWWPTVNGHRRKTVDTPQVRALYEAHPEWFAMDVNGERPYPANHYAKLETTDPGLVRWYADRAIAALKASERPVTYSLSPSDGGGWSQSPESRALYDPNPTTTPDPSAPASRPSMSSLVLRWYHDVARLVADEYPQGRLTGYIYAEYLYPPVQASMELPGNFTPMIATSFNYGYGLHRPSTQSDFDRVMRAWARVAPADWYYYDLPNQLHRQDPADIGSGNFPGSSGIISPAAPDILDTIFSTLLACHIEGAHIYGAASWSNAAMANWLLARMEWDPELSATALRREWLHRAYGVAAGTQMEAFYVALDGWIAAHYRQHPKAGYKVGLFMLEEVYATNYQDLEAMYLAAQSQSMTPRQRQRLDLIGDNLVVLQWRLRNAGLLDEALASPLRRDDADIATMLTARHADFPRFPGMVTNSTTTRSRPVPYDATIVTTPADDAPDSLQNTAYRLSDDTVLLHATGDTQLTIVPSAVAHGAYAATYDLRNSEGVTVRSGVLVENMPITLPVAAGSTHYLILPQRKPSRYRLAISGGAIATASRRGDVVRLHGTHAPIRVVHVPRQQPMGIYSRRDTVLIQKPFIGNSYTSSLLQSGAVRAARVLASLTDGWRFYPDSLHHGDTVQPHEADGDRIDVLNWWQRQQWPDFFGRGWYRATFPTPDLAPGERLHVYVGSIDGHASVYLNDELIGEHLLGPQYQGWNKPFSFVVPDSLLQAGADNSLKIRVDSKSDDTLSGITGGVALVGALPR